MPFGLCILYTGTTLNETHCVLLPVCLADTIPTINVQGIVLYEPKP